MRTQLSDPHTQLLRLLKSRVSREPWIAQGVGEAGPPALVLEAFEAEPWASLTFTGMRHCMDMRLDGAATAVESVYRALSLWADEPDCGLAGHFFAELQIAETTREVREFGRMSLGLRLEALTIEE